MKASCQSDAANLTVLLHPNILQFFRPGHSFIEAKPLP